ncbi:MAG: flagellar protein FliS [Planctomycetaceae bacterium]|nr:flagellar protein FliS [Planctomycetaceae bacterium]
MDPRLRYRESKVLSWTRIDMLLLIYEAAIEALDRGVAVLESGDQSQLSNVRFDAQRKILLIADGLAIDKDETAVRIMNICVFILDQLQTDSAENWRSCVKLLETLHEGFEAIAEDARKLEREGKIPTLS